MNIDFVVNSKTKRNRTKTLLMKKSRIISPNK